MNPNPQFAATFLHEAEDLLAQVEEIVLQVEQHRDPEAVHRLFRAFHTIKGSGAMFGFDAVANFTHHVETVLDEVREGRLAISSQLIDLILTAKDHIKALLQGAAEEAGEPIMTGLQALLNGGGGLPPSTAEAAAKTIAEAPGASKKVFQIHFRPAGSIMANGLDPAALLNELRGLGPCSVATSTTLVPALDQIQPDQCYLCWDITLTTEQDLNAVRDVFIFVEDESELRIQRQEQAPAVSDGSTSPNPAGDAPGVLPSAPPATPVEAVTPAGPDKPVAESASKRADAAKATSTVRVASDRLDRLVNLVGELVINQSRLAQVSARTNVPELAAPVEEIERLVTELRDNVLGIRMMPIGTTFGRFRRLVRDLSVELGKEINLVSEGEETELDKTVIDQLGDPLMHLLRNSIDHGIEAPEDRERIGKPRAGTIRLAATHEGSHVLITITDDGRGLDTEAIRAKAIEKQLIAADASLSPREVCNLIFLPGFSTAREVTSVSGRGVGMDVVRRQVEALRGKVEVSSEPGRGTTISLTLPLTLAIIEGLLVEINQDYFILPMSIVAENVELPRAHRTRNNGRNVIAVRGELVPYLRLRELFAYNGSELEIEKVVIVNHAGSRLGLVVDRVISSHQTVIQSLGRFYRDVDVVSGATIMGDGRVALILDIARIVQYDAHQRQATGAALSLN